MDMLFCKTAQEQIFRCLDSGKISWDAKTFLKQGEMLCLLFLSHMVEVLELSKICMLLGLNKTNIFPCLQKGLAVYVEIFTLKFNLVDRMKSFGMIA